MRPAAVLALAAVAVTALAGPRAYAQAPAAPAGAPAHEPAYVTRGRQTEVRQKELTARVEAAHTALEAALKAHARDLLPQLEPPPTPVPGYNVLPRLTPDAVPASTRARPVVVSYYWGWSDKLIAGEMTALGELEALLAHIDTLPDAERHAQYADAVKKYRHVVDDRRMIDADINYNWYWMRDIEARRGVFDALQKTQDAAVERERLEAALAEHDETALRTLLKDQVPAGADAARLQTAAQARLVTLTRTVNAQTGYAAERPWLTITRTAPDTWTLTARLYTDIPDRRFIDQVARGIERIWSVDDESGGQVRHLRLRVPVTVLTPKQLYCAKLAKGEPCRPPQKGKPIDVDMHAARFPQDGGLLTTGAATLRFVGQAGVALSPSDTSVHTLAHEFGHILGFPDAYFRGYRDMGDEGYRVTEFGASGDIMSAPGVGPVLARHYDLILGARAQALINRSLGFYNERRYADCLDTAKQALELVPDSAAAYNNIAAANASLGRWQDAVDAASHALRIDPAFQMARNNLAWAQSELDKARSQPH